MNSKYDSEDVEDMIRTLNNYKMSKGKKYKSDYHTILNWVAEKVLESEASKRRAMLRKHGE